MIHNSIWFNSTPSVICDTIFISKIMPIPPLRWPCRRGTRLSAHSGVCLGLPDRFSNKRRGGEVEWGSLFFEVSDDMRLDERYIFFSSFFWSLSWLYFFLQSFSQSHVLVLSVFFLKFSHLFFFCPLCQYFFISLFFHEICLSPPAFSSSFFKFLNLFNSFHTPLHFANFFGFFVVSKQLDYGL